MRDPSENSNSNSEHNREGNPQPWTGRRRPSPPQSPRVRVSTRNGPGLTRNFRYNNSNTNNNNVGNIRPRVNNSNNMTYAQARDWARRGPPVRPRVRQRIHNADELRRYTTGVARQLFGNGNNKGPSSPGRKPKAVNVSKYEKMLKDIENKNKNKNTKNNKPNNENKNVVSWFNNSMAEAKKSNIPKDKRVFLITDMTTDGKIKQVWDRRFLNGLVESYETRYNRVREANDPFFTSPLTRKKFSKNDIKAYPPTDATKKIIKRIMNGRVLEAKVNKIMKIKNKDYLARSNIFETIKNGIRKGDITTEKQIEELALIYRVTGREMLMSGHKKDGDYYTAYVKRKFKTHHIKFMKDASSIVSLLYDTGLSDANPARAISPLYKLPEMATYYLSGFEKYFEQPLNMRPNNSNSKKENQKKILQQRRVIRRVLRQIVKNGFVRKGDLYIKEEIRELTNSNLRNKLSEYYDWYELVRNASS